MDDCILSHLKPNEDGYCMKSVGSRSDGTYRRRPHHVLAYEAVWGPVPDGLQVDHLCFVPNCINVDHLEPVTPAENLRRSWDSGRRSHMSGEGAKNSRLNAVAVRAIRHLHAEGRTQTDLAVAHGVSQALISKVVRREAWKDVA